MSFTTTALAAFMLTILALGAPSTKMAYAETDPGFASMGGTRVIEPARKYSIADKPATFRLFASVLSAQGKVIVHVAYAGAGPWDTKQACETFAYGSGDGASALDDAIDALAEATAHVLPKEKIAGVGVSCVPSQE